MASHESSIGQSDEWYTPPWVFNALGVEFDLDPCVPNPNVAGALGWRGPYTPTKKVIWEGGHLAEWIGSVWLNPPYGVRNGIVPWLEKFIAHGDGIALVPNRTGADWFQDLAAASDCLLFVRGKIKFLRPDGTEGESPGYGNVLCAVGRRMKSVLRDSAVRGLRVC